MRNKYSEETLKIAKFMGIQPMKGISNFDGGVYYYYNNSEMQDYEALPFYNTWDELMPVVIKIESIGGRHENILEIFGNCVNIGDEQFFGETKVEAVYKAVVWCISKLDN